MNDDLTTPLPRDLGEGPGHGPVTGEDPAAAAAGARARRRGSRRRDAGSGRRRAAVISAAAALVVAAVAGHGVMSAAHSSAGNAAVAVAAGDLPPAPTTPGTPAALSSASTTASVPASASPSAPAGSTAPAAGSPSAGAGTYRKKSAARPTARPTATPTATASDDSRPGGTAAVTTAPPATGTAAQFARQVADLTNTERAKAGCGPLTVNPQAQTAAQVHSDDMVARHYFDHPDPEGHHADYRLIAAGYSFSSWGENIAYGQPDPAAVVDEWMHSPPHRENILNCTFTVIGVGVNFGADGPWWTQVFATPA
ncbi:CAP domain-containing protein [Kitasatospora sp. MAP5-34]|uniref:CAP domain-containing protein n=1 Tax=Kitasatospora sp. MAP5-34 TaxID=3035102 RepID=UPI002473A495|nr:CAP domain-containing protein [Kitasatospora sp. MAP5-34]MDH6574403.1 uncharacterized protein YkwD [Kitasatospora sp. MAP5-34]